MYEAMLRLALMVKDGLGTPRIEPGVAALGELSE